MFIDLTPSSVLCCCTASQICNPTELRHSNVLLSSLHALLAPLTYHLPSFESTCSLCELQPIDSQFRWFAVCFRTVTARYTSHTVYIHHSLSFNSVLRLKYNVKHKLVHVLKHQNIKTDGRVEARLLTFLTEPLDRGNKCRKEDGWGLDLLL